MLDAGGWRIRNAYVQLSTCRSIGMDIGPIPWTAAELWCRLNNVTGAAARHLIDVVLLVDGDYMSKLREKSKTTDKQGNPEP